MDKALRHFQKLKNGIVNDDEMVRAAWRAVVGEKIEARAHYRELVRDRIVVEVEDRVWQSQLNTLERQILGRLDRILGRSVARQIEFRIAIPRPKPQRAEESGAEFRLEMSDPEARKIADPGLRRVYLKSKRRAAV